MWCLMIGFTQWPPTPLSFPSLILNLGKISLGLMRSTTLMKMMIQAMTQHHHHLL
jgi:hypothetical protein